MDDFLFGLFIIILVMSSAIAAMMTSLVIIGPNQCGIFYHLGTPRRILMPGMHFKSSVNQVKRIKMDENTWESELNLIKNQFPEFRAEIETFKSNAKNIYGSRLKEPHGRFAAIVCPKCNNRIEVNLDEYR